MLLVKDKLHANSLAFQREITKFGHYVLKEIEGSWGLYHILFHPFLKIPASLP